MSSLAVDRLVVVSDTHCGCRMGLCPPEVKLDDGGTYQPGKTQRFLWSAWREFWDEWVPRVTEGEPYAVVMNGDAMDGVHHGSVTQVSQNLTDQRRIAAEVLRPVVDLCGGRYIHIRGTEAHVGKSGQNEEDLAESLGAIPNDDGQFARWDLWCHLGGYLGHFSHHIAACHSPMTEATALHSEYIRSCVEAAQHGLRAPDFIVRSHRHRAYETKIPSRNGDALVATTAAWQGKTPFVWKLASGRAQEPQFGGMLLVAGENGVYTRKFTKILERSRTHTWT